MARIRQSQRSKRKDEHLELAEKEQGVRRSSDFDFVHLVRPTLPETDVAQVDLHTSLFGKTLAAPLYINAMTGGSEKSASINGALARIAAKLNIGMALGSAAILVAEPNLVDTFAIARKENPQGLIFANINPLVPPHEALKIIGALKADALQIHVNALQEAVMPEGDRDFRWLARIKALKEISPVPVIVKEVGFGFDPESFRMLRGAGIEYVDVAGAGGTNFVDIENARRKDFSLGYLATAGFSTVKSLINAQGCGVGIFASGGMRNALDMLKSLTYGSMAVGISGALLHILVSSGEKAALQFAADLIEQLRMLCALYGIAEPVAATQIKKYYDRELLNYISQKKHSFSLD